MGCCRNTQILLQYFISKIIKTVLKSYLSMFSYWYFLGNVEKPPLERWLARAFFRRDVSTCCKARQRRLVISHFPFWSQNRSQGRSSYEPWQTSLWIEFRSCSRQNYQVSLVHVCPLFIVSTCHIMVPT